MTAGNIPQFVKMKFKIVITQVIEKEYEMILENDNVMQALDEARSLVEIRNKSNKNGQFFVTKIDTIRDSDEEALRLEYGVFS